MSIETNVHSWPTEEKFLTLPLLRKKAYLRAALATLESGAQVRLAHHLGVSPRAVNDWPKEGKSWPSVDREAQLWQLVLCMLREMAAAGAESGTSPDRLGETVRERFERLRKEIDVLEALVVKRHTSSFQQRP